MGSGGVVFLLVRFYTLAERFIFGLAFFSLLLLLLKDGRCFSGGSGGLRRLMPLIGECTTNRAQRREDGEQDFRIDRFQHRSLRSGKIGVPGAAFVAGAGVVSRTLLLDEDGSVEVFGLGVTPLHVCKRHLRSKASL